jgi:hypothetical protein
VKKEIVALSLLILLCSCSSGFYTCYDGPNCKDLVDKLMKSPGKVKDLREDTVITTPNFREISMDRVNKFINLVNNDFKRKYVIVHDSIAWFVSGYGKNEIRDQRYLVDIKNIEGNKEIIFDFRFRKDCYKLNNIFLHEPIIDAPLHYGE